MEGDHSEQNEQHDYHNFNNNVSEHFSQPGGAGSFGEHSQPQDVVAAQTEAPASRKNSELIREAQATFSTLPLKDALDLREFLTESFQQIKTYELTEDNLKLLKRLRRYFFL